MAAGTGTILAATAATQIIGGIIGNEAARKDRNARDQAMNQAMQVLLDAGYPPDVAKPLLLKEYKAQGIYTPELEKDVEKVTSQLGGIQENKEVQDFQMNALRQIAQRATGGLTEEDRVAMMNLQDQMAQQSQQQQAALEQNLAQRGISGGGAEIAGRLAGSQNALQMGAQGARQLMGDQSRRALEALAQQGSMSGQIRGQDFDVARAKADAADAMNRFNVGNQMSVQSRNVANKNQALAQDWANRQAIGNMNVGQSNDEAQRQLEGKQWMYDADLRRRGGQSAAYQQQAGLHGQRASEAAGQIQGLTNAISGGIGMYGQYQQNQDLMDRLDRKNFQDEMEDNIKSGKGSVAVPARNYSNNGWRQS